MHLAAVVNFGYVTISNKSLKNLAANVYNKELSGRDLEQHCDMVISEFIEPRTLALKTLYKGPKHSPLSFGMTNKKMVRKEKHLIFRFPVFPDSGFNKDLSYVQGSREYWNCRTRSAVPVIKTDVRRTFTE